LVEPPPVDEIGGASSPVIDRSPADLLAAADLHFDRRPDVDEVRHAQSLYLEATKMNGAPAEAFFGSARSTAWLIEHETDGERRKALAVEAVQISQWCGRLYPNVVECDYRLALAVGQQARERSSTAVDGLDVMVELLRQVIAAEPELDFAGGHRVLALVLLRAPGWPTGPGDPEAGLEHARMAVEIAPDYPPNQLVLGEALIENKRRDEAVDVFGFALGLAAGETGDPDAAEWLTAAEEALIGLR
jgi:hypothetical protein